MLLALVAALSLSGDPIGGGSTAVAQPPPPVPAATAAAPATKLKARTAANDTICWVEKPVGSHIPHRFCAPRIWWEERQRQDRESLSGFYQSSGGGGGQTSASPMSGK